MAAAKRFYVSATLLTAMSLVGYLGTAAEKSTSVITLDNFEPPDALTADEPLASAFSFDKAAAALDNASLQWTSSRKCATCHTNLPYLMARPALSGIRKDSGEVLAFMDQQVAGWKEKQPERKRGAYVVATAAALVFYDRATGKPELRPSTRAALDMMWNVQREDGGWDWLKCGWPPMESDDHYGVSLAALAIGMAPVDCRQSESAKRGIEGIRAYLASTPPVSLHHRAMIAWASLHFDGLMDAKARDEVLAEMLKLQRPDGGWSTPGLLADWKEFRRKDNKPHDVESSDVYGAAFVIYLARQFGTPATDERLLRGLTWLKQQQRESGRWFSRSPAKDSKHFISNVGSAFAILAFDSCGQIPGQ